MDIKTYLSQAYRIDHRINSKLEQIVSLHELATKATSTLSDMPRNSSRNMSSMAEIVAKIVDLENEINQEIDSLIEIKREIMSAIKKVPSPELQTLLELRYMSFNTWEQVSNAMGYSLQHIFRLHGKALRSLKF